RGDWREGWALSRRSLMPGYALAFLGLTLSCDPVVLRQEVYEVDTQQFKLPIWVDPDERDKIESIRVFVSVDRGKSWSARIDCKPIDDGVPCLAQVDGMYWFALQIHNKDGTSEPANEKDLVPTMKVHVNAQRKTLKPQEPSEDLKSEVEELRKTVERQ